MTMFESEATCGGHTLTDTSGPYPVDLGFQVGTQYFGIVSQSASLTAAYAACRLLQSHAGSQPRASSTAVHMPSATVPSCALQRQLTSTQLFFM